MFPDVYEKYKELCEEGKIKVGEPYIYRTKEDEKELPNEKKKDVQDSLSSNEGKKISTL